MENYYIEETSQAVPLARRDDLTAKANDHLENAKSQNTKKAYERDWLLFSRWCDDMGYSFLPAQPEAVQLFITDMAEKGRKASTIQRYLSTISQFHQLAKQYNPVRDPLVRLTWQGLRKSIGTAQKGKKAAVLEDVRAMVANLPDSLLGIRDRAILVLGFAGAFRRSELVNLNVEDVEFEREGLKIIVRRSKTDQTSQGEKVAIAYGSNPKTCPVRTLEDWLEAANIEEGAIFRPIGMAGFVQDGRLSDKAVARVVQRQAERIGKKPGDFGGHSLRSGLATTAAKAGKSERAIMKQGRWKSSSTVQRYIKDATLFDDNATVGIGL